MFKNYFIIALRTLRKQRLYSFINIGGLSIGLAACLVICLYILHELSYDRHFALAHRIYRVNSEIKFGSLQYKLATGNPPLAALLQQDYPEVASTVRFRNRGSQFVKTEKGKEAFKETKVVWTDSTFFKILSLPVLQGDGTTALTEPNTIAISQTIARKYFPDGNALDETLIMGNNQRYKITAIFEDIPANTHFHFDMLVAMAGLKEAQNTSLVSGGDFYTYLLLEEGADAAALENKLPGFVNKYVAPQISGIMGGDFTMDKFRASGNIWEYTLTPMVDIHLHSDRLGEFEPNGSMMYVYLFSVIALFILLIATINFMNLSTARSASRAREVGVRKVMGSQRYQLVGQFLTESFLITIFSILLALMVVQLMLPFLNDFMQKQLSLPLHHPFFYGVLIIACILVALLAGLYPAFFLSAFKPIRVLKGQLSRGRKSSTLRSTLVVFQFMISIFLIIATIAVNRQLHFIQSKKVGFQKDHVIVVDDANMLGNKIEAFKQDMLKNSFIRSGTISGYLPVSGTWRSSDTFWKEGVQPTQESMEDMVSMQTWGIDYDYFKTLGMTLKTGRAFSAGFSTDSAAVILNEAALQRFDFGDDPLGKKISTFDGSLPDGTPDPENIRSWTVIGVVENFHFESMKQNIAPLAFFLNKSNGFVSFRFEGTGTKDVIEQLEKTWKAMAPLGQPFQYSFLDEDFGKMYDAEQRLGRIFTTFAVLAILIACLGLFTLTAFTAEQRTKEIGIRKVLGASVNSIVLLLSREFGKLVLMAFLLAAPAAYYAITWWLQNYSYKVEVGWMMFVLGGAIAFTIACLTMGYQSIKAALTNPVDTLKNE